MSAIPDSTPRPTSLVVRMADRSGLEPERYLATVKATCFRTDKPITNEQLAALLVVCERYNLDPFAKHLWAYPDKGGGIVPVVSIDGWIWLVNRQPRFDGMEFDYDESAGAMTCTIWIKGRSHAVKVTEYIAECRRETDPWKRMPRRMIRHRALVQCARVAFGLSGIYDEEEADDILAGRMPRTVSAPAYQPSNAERFRAMQSATDITPVEPPDAPQSETNDTGPPVLEDFVREMERVHDSFAGEMILEEAREFLDEGDQRELASVFNHKFPPDQPEGDEQ